MKVVIKRAIKDNREYLTKDGGNLCWTNDLGSATTYNEKDAKKLLPMLDNYRPNGAIISLINND